MTSAPQTEQANIRVRVPAKINIALGVGAVRADGYHPLTTVFQTVSLYDKVTAELAKPGIFELAVDGIGEGVPRDDTNLALRAAKLLADRYAPNEPLGVSLNLLKAIPVAGGMAGGSADAAASLLACSVLWDLDVELEELRELGSELGSDVPFPLLGGTALGAGRGERLLPILTRGHYHWVLAFAREGLSTAAVFRRFDEIGEVGSLDVPTELLDALGAGDPQRVADQLRNDLTAAAVDLQPGLTDTLALGREHGALASMVSGSGPTCAFLAASEADAIELSTRLASEPSILGAKRVSAPAGGAKLVS